MHSCPSLRRTYLPADQIPYLPTYLPIYTYLPSLTDESSQGLPIHLGTKLLPSFLGQGTSAASTRPPQSSPDTMNDRNRLVPASEVKELIDDGKLIVIYEGFALKLDSWINKHPGGRLAILHMVGRDASDEINV